MCRGAGVCDWQLPIADLRLSIYDLRLGIGEPAQIGKYNDTVVLMRAARGRAYVC